MESNWAITSYYNPLRGAHRRRNYDVFRRHLRMPLLTVEWSPEGRFELGPRDAEILVQLAGGGLLWQKERLLNVALGRLPAECSCVAWLDCDIVFHDPDWAPPAARLCERHAVVQLYQTSHDLAPTSGTLAGLDQVLATPRQSTRPSMFSLQRKSSPLFDAAGLASGASDPNFKPRGKVGMAYMARTELLRRIGLYDANVVGGGDLVFVAAILGKLDELFAVRPFAPGHADSIRAWARALGPGPLVTEPARACLPVEVSHLWHGDKDQRIYAARYRLLADTGYDPGRDLVRSASGVWDWAAHAHTVQTAVGEYLGSRADA